MPDNILVSELFGPVIQGEGALTGQISHFLRTSGCPLRCAWCDSMHAVDPKQIAAKSRAMAPEAIVAELTALPPARWVTLTGGDPVAWDLTSIVHALRLAGYKTAVETQATLWHDYLKFVDLVTASPKPPSSGQNDKVSIPMLERYQILLQSRIVLKIVVFNDEDLAFAEHLHQRFPRAPLYLSAGTPPPNPHGTYDLPGLQRELVDNYRWLTETTLKRPALADATLGMQLHVLLYGRALGV